LLNKSRRKRERAAPGLGCRPFEDEEPERLEPEVDEAPLAVREVAAEAGAHHALPPGAVDRVKLLLDVRRDAPAVEDVEAVEGPGRRRHRLRLHLRRHVRVLHHRLPFQHGVSRPALR